ncbi:MAG TPA: hypothetical protein VK253_03885 [Candidatus Binatia bacterium]|nr:hypothetical protein [Candidatus Binatia bacterium]
MRPCPYYEYGDKQTNRTKNAIVLVAITALTLSILGLTAAQIAQHQPYTNTTANSAAITPSIIFRDG